MQTTLSPNAERLSAALKALRLTHDHDPHQDNKTVLGAKCLKVVIAQLAEDGVATEDLQPLIDLEAGLKQGRPRGGRTPNRRRGGTPSEALLARVSAVIDLLVKAGYDEGEAAQILMRRLLAAGVSGPTKGGDARGWKRLLEWRADLSHGIGSADAKAEYEDFTRELEAIPAGERVKRVLDEQPWDLRQKPRGV
jgi:hypothetical protein